MLKKTAARQGGLAPAQKQTTPEINATRHMSTTNERNHTSEIFGSSSLNVSRNDSGRHDASVSPTMASARNDAVIPRLTTAARSEVPSSSLRKAFMPAYISSAITANPFRPTGSPTSPRRCCEMKGTWCEDLIQNPIQTARPQTNSFATFTTTSLLRHTAPTKQSPLQSL